MEKIKISLVLIMLLGNTESNAEYYGVSFAEPKKDDKGALVASPLPDPFKGFLLIDETIFQEEQLSDLPGRIVAIAVDKQGTVLLLPYGNRVKIDGIKPPEVKPSQFNYDSYLLDTKSAHSIGIPLSEVQLKGNYKVEYRFYKSATSRISLDEIDEKKFLDLAKRIRANFAQQNELTLKSIEVISTAGILNTSYSVMQGVEAKADISGPGWKVGNSFYSTQQMSKNRSRFGVALVPFVEDTSSLIKPRDINSNLYLSNNQAVPADLKINISGVDIRNAMRLE